ncbi:MAG: phosphate acyltransferase PlsX [Chthonomonadales bacterium]
MAVQPLTIAVDAMGGDLGPEEVVRGVVTASGIHAGKVNFIIVGNEEIIQRELTKLTKGKPSLDNVTVQHASQTIEMTDKPREVYRRKPDASVVVSARLVKEGAANAFVSIGNTGAAMAASLFLFRTIPGVARPAIATPLPSLSGKIPVLLDAGANVDCNAEQLLHFAVMGVCYARQVLGVKKPTVGLLSNGEEESKGNELTREAHKLLKAFIPEFHGNVEGRQVFEGAVDVIVCDGFDGNIVLKTGEGVAEMVLGLLKIELSRHQWMKLFILPLRSGIRKMRAKIDYREFGGAPLLGVNGVCIIGHGRSDQRAIVNAIRVAEMSVRNNLVKEITDAMADLSERTAIQTEEVVH